MRMRLPPKDLVWSIAVAMPIMVGGMALPLHATDTPTMDIQESWRCNHTPNLDPQVCVSTEGGVMRYRIDTEDGTHAELTLSKEGVWEIKQTGPNVIRVRFGHAPAPTSRPGMVRLTYKDANMTINEVRDRQPKPIWVIQPHDDRPSRFLIEMCEAAGCSGNIELQQPQ